ncbi:MAG: pilus assembly protein CpaF [Frankiaceae bacterium]|jgi:pilus assembly protein CpaF|nr:pilus assembly protein CpaF [Frankiaceae bacterium]
MTEDLLTRVRRRLADDGAAAPEPAELARLVRAESTLAADTQIANAVRVVTADVTGFGPLDDLLRRPGVTDVLVNGPEDVWLDDGQGLRRCAVVFPDEGSVLRTAQRLLATAGRRVDLAHPFVDARLPGGVRLHVVLPPISERTVLSLRVPRRQAFSLADLAAAGSVSLEMAAVLTDLLGARLSFVVTGGTGAGKTTVLAALVGAVDPRERIVVIEDTAELAHTHPHAVHLQSRQANAEGAGSVTMADLVRQSLRMRPDRIVVGEARGPEVIDLLAALNTGHAGSASTVHANKPHDVPARFAALGAMAGVSAAAIDRQVAAGLSVVIHVDRDASGRRHVAAVAVVTSRASAVIVEPALTVERAGAAAVRGPAWSDLAALLGR